ncbi:MAG: SpoIIE family protein phosphatase [Gemmatimonadota bacterium]|nr:MAG: SpoIIE family protein phosphatase [Gemmatimonadota bacterium]
MAAPPVEVDDDGVIVPLDETRLLNPVPELKGYWFEVAESENNPTATLTQLEPLISGLLAREKDSLNLQKALFSRYEEIELIYAISETLGTTIHLNEAAQKIVEEVSQVVGARRASILVYDERAGYLTAVAGVGKDVSEFGPIALDDDRSVAARVFREQRIIAYDPRDAEARNPGCGQGRDYRGTSFLSVPITYPQPDGSQRPVGVINLTDRTGTDAFSGGERRLVSLIASQIAVAIENSRLVAQDIEQQRLRQELTLAHDLQLKLMPSPAVLGPNVDAAAHCQQAEGVGGDLYNFVRLQRDLVGVMLGDVSSHGFSAALIMALVLSAAGIHAAEAATPDGALRALFESVRKELADTEMHLALFYGVADRQSGVLRYSNAGHPHAFMMRAGGERERLAATSPPLGLADVNAIAAKSTEWQKGEDLLVLFSDGVADAVDGEGARFGEEQILDLVEANRESPAATIVDVVAAAVSDFSGSVTDDRTILILRA